jgi:hypothetical protein
MSDDSETDVSAIVFEMEDQLRASANELPPFLGTNSATGDASAQCPCSEAKIPLAKSFANSSSQ